MKLSKHFLKTQIALLTAIMFFVAGTVNVSAQNHDKNMDKKHDMQNMKSMDSKKLNDMQTKNEAYLVDIYKIVDKYPDFSYEYEYDNGKLERVVVTGIEDSNDKDRVAKLIYNVRSNNDNMKNYCDMEGIYYVPEKDAKPKIGYEQFRDKIKENLTYPENAKNFGVEGTVYVKFIVDDDGNVTHLTADQAIDSPYDNRVEKLEEKALAAVEEVDADWEPAKVDGDYVDSWVVVPVTFEFKKDPSLPVLIR